MKPDRWTQIEMLCQEVLSLPEEERLSYLQQACGRDKALYSEVENLLKQLDSEFLTQPFVRITPSAVFSEEEFTKETFIGSYKLIRTLATGGMGQVYLAVRNDGNFDRHVALKVIRNGLISDESLTRFYSERQILASLNHPNIARLFDGGTTGDGLPWFTMEYVEGLPITDYCERHSYTIKERLHLFLEVCSAIQYAHQNLIVHRDIKPGNILITPDGEPKLLDFGISNILAFEQESGQGPTHLSMMTPEYASPEQVLNEPVSTASDVYALGVLFYELLTGTLPYTLENRSPEAIERIICKKQPEKPSVAARDKRLAGDLDDILYKALQKDPKNRYPSVEQFSGDLRRYLNDLPIMARRHSFPYRVQKYLRRNRWSVGISVVIAVLILAFGTLTWIQSVEIRAKAVETEQQRDRAENISEFLIGLFESADPSEAENVSITALELLNRGVDRAENELGDQPYLQSELFLVISEVYESLGLYREAEELASRALGVRRELFNPGHADIATVLNTLGWLRYRQGDYHTADSLLSETLTIRKGIFGEHHLDVARTLNDLAVIRQARGDFPATDSLLNQALEIRRELYGSSHEAVGITLSNYAALKWRMNDLNAAEELMREALDNFQTSVGNEDLRISVTMTNLAALLLTKGEIEEAESLYREALAVRLQLVGEEHPDVAYSFAHLGNLLRMKGEYEKAETYLIRASELREKLLGTDHVLVGDSKRTLGLLYNQIEDYDHAEEQYKEAISIFRSVFPEGHVRTAEVLHLLGELYLSIEKPNLAETDFREALKIREKNFGREDSRTAKTRVLLGISLVELGNVTEAKSLLAQGLEILERVGDDTDELKLQAERVLAGL